MNYATRLDVACDALRAALMNPYAVERYLSKPAKVEQAWKDAAKKAGCIYGGRK